MMALFRESLIQKIEPVHGIFPGSEAFVEHFAGLVEPSLLGQPTQKYQTI